MGFLKSIWAMIAGTIIGSLVFIKSLFIIRLKVTSLLAQTLLESVITNGKVLEFEKEYVKHRMPKIYTAFVWYKGCTFWFTISTPTTEHGDEQETSGMVSCFRWDVERIMPQMKLDFSWQENTESNVYIVRTYGSEKIGKLDISQKITPYLEEEKYKDIESDIKEVINTDKGRKKLGVILHGQPGNGKSYLIRYFAVKYKLPIYIFSLEKEMTNQDIIRMFNNITGPGIVIFEDFDSYFDKRKCKLERNRFTFDTFLNALDGLYCNTKGMVYFLTTNNISKVDSSLKSRPSRFKYVMNITNPSLEIRKRIFGDNTELLKKTQNASLDKCLYLKEKYEYQKTGRT